MTARLQFSSASRLNIEMPTLDELEADRGDDTCESEGEDYDADEAPPAWAWDSPTGAFRWPAWTEARCAVCCDAPWHDESGCAAALGRISGPKIDESHYVEERPWWGPPARVDHTVRLGEWVGEAKRARPAREPDRVCTSKPTGLPALSREKVAEIRNLLADGVPSVEIAKLIGIKPESVSNIKRGKFYK